MSMREFTAPIEGMDGGGAFVIIPFDVEKEYGKKRVPIRATIDGESYRGSLVRMGGTSHVLGIRKDIRAKIGKDIGDTVRVTVEEDAEERVVDVPEDLRLALSRDAEAGALFDRLSYTHRKEFANWITESKREQTRSDRVRKTLEMLRDGRTR